jgi:hypothetical protein
MIRAGTAVIDITPPAGLFMSGFAARTEPATGAHDPLTVRALAIDDTAIVVADVLGLDEAMSQRIRERCVLPAGRVIVAALHTHGGPATLPRFVAVPDSSYMQRLEDAGVAAIDRAVAAQQPATLSVGMGADPGVAKNRRHDGGPVDPALPVLRVRDAAGRIVAVLTSYACHPVTLSADNRLWTADYPHYFRTAIETAYPGATALFLTGCAGDANMGHSAYASQTLAVSDERTFATAEKLGGRIAAAAIAAPETPLGNRIQATDCMVELGFERRETQPLAELAAEWRAAAVAEPGRRALLEQWVAWADKWAPVQELGTWAGRVTVFDWGGVPLVGLPGEIFAETALSLRAALHPTPALVFSYAESEPGYFPPRGEYRSGGYEVDEAHRYIGMPASFAPGSAEALAEAALRLLGQAGFGPARRGE